MSKERQSDMVRYIDAKLLDETIDKYQTELESNITSIWYKNKPLYKGLAYLRRIIREEIPTVDVAPRSEGEWSRYEVNCSKGYGQVYYQHKDCDFNATQLFPSSYHYCPNCGAKMKGGGE